MDLFVAAVESGGGGQWLTESTAAEETVFCARGRRRRVLQVARLVSVSGLSGSERTAREFDLPRFATPSARATCA